MKFDNMFNSFFFNFAKFYNIFQIYKHFSIITHKFKPFIFAKFYISSVLFYQQ